MDYPTFASSSSSKKKEGSSNGRSSPSYNLSRFSSQTMQEQDHFRNDVWSSSHPSPLSNEFSPRKEESTYTAKPNETERRGNFNGFSKSPEAPVCINEFHFSIYKWPQYEIPVVIPLRQRIKSKSKEKDACFPEEEVLSQPPETIISRRNTVNESNDTVLRDKSEETKPSYLAEVSLTEETKKGATVFAEEAPKPELKRLHSILHGDINEQGTMCFKDSSNLEVKLTKNLFCCV